LRVIREMRAQGMKARQIIERLNAENLPLKIARKWTNGMFYRTLRECAEPSQPNQV